MYCTGAVNCGRSGVRDRLLHVLHGGRELWRHRLPRRLSDSTLLCTCHLLFPVGLDKTFEEELIQRFEIFTVPVSECNTEKFNELLRTLSLQMSKIQCAHLHCPDLLRNVGHCELNPLFQTNLSALVFVHLREHLGSRLLALTHSTVNLSPAGSHAKPARKGGRLFDEEIKLIGPNQTIPVAISIQKALCKVS